MPKWVHVGDNQWVDPEMVEAVLATPDNKSTVQLHSGSSFPVNAPVQVVLEALGQAGAPQEERMGATRGR